MITQLAVFLEEKKISHFVTYKNNLFKILFGTCILIFLIGAFIAIPALDIVYGTNLKQYQTSFVVLLLGGIASTFSRTLYLKEIMAASKRSRLFAHGPQNLHPLNIPGRRNICS